MFISVVIPTYNRRAILEKCLKSLESQDVCPEIEKYEVIVVDDGSTDGTFEWIKNNSSVLPHVRVLVQDHGGAAAGRNRGVKNSKGDVIVFIDSDLVVTPKFLSSHAKTISKNWKKKGHKLCFTYGAVINTNNFENPTSENFKVQDISWAYFATGNVAIDKKLLVRSGLFDTVFRLYGWEDLELGERLRSMGVELVNCPNAVGYHWHPAFKIDQIPDLIRIEKERAKMGLVFYRKHPTFRVRLIIQFTLFHLCLWELLTLGGLINVKTLRPLLAFLVRKGQSGIAMEILRLPLNRLGVKEIYREAAAIGL